MGNATWDGGSIWVRLNADCVKVNKKTTPKLNQVEDEDATTKLGHKNVIIF